MFFLCDSCGLRALETLIQSQHYFNLLLCRWLIRDLVCVVLYFSTRRVLSVILITKIPSFSLSYSPASSQTVSYFFLEDAQKKLALLLQSLRKEEMAIIFVLFQDKKWNELSSMVFQTKLHSIKLFQVSKTSWSPAWGLTSRPAALNEFFSMSEKKKVRSLYCKQTKKLIKTLYLH